MRKSLGHVPVGAAQSEPAELVPGSAVPQALEFCWNYPVEISWHFLYLHVLSEEMPWGEAGKTQGAWKAGFV